MKKTLFLVLIVILSLSVYSQSNKRVALVIGNAQYKYGNSLKNPVNDAELMSRILQKLDFQVIIKTNATRKEMQDAVIDFCKLAKTCEVALFYYAGHGIQVDGINYIIPSDSKIDEPMAVQFEALKVDNIVSQFEYYPSHQNIVILDACRENPFLTWVRGGMNSFAAANAPRGTIIAFSTGSGSVAYDNNTASNGLYTGILAKQMLMPQRIEDVFINTRNQVYKASNGKQQPQEWSQLSEAFFLTKKELTLTEAKSIVLKDGKVIIKPVVDGQLYIDNKLIGKVIHGQDFLFDKPIKGMRKFEIKGNEYWCDSLYIAETENSTNSKSLENPDNLQDFSKSNAGSFIDNLDKITYKWVRIGKQIWMAENCKKYINEDKSICYNYDNKNVEIMGMLYTWEGAQNTCPLGWHLPSKDEYLELFEFLGNNDQLGSKLKSTITKDQSQIRWDNQEKVKISNNSGFSALPVGVSEYPDIFTIQNSSAHFWTSTVYGKKNANCIIMWSHDNIVRTDVCPTTNYLSVRCIKNK